MRGRGLKFCCLYDVYFKVLRTPKLAPDPLFVTKILLSQPKAAPFALLQ